MTVWPDVLFPATWSFIIPHIIRLTIQGDYYITEGEWSNQHLVFLSNLIILLFIPNNITISTDIVSKYGTTTAIVIATARVRLAPRWVFLFFQNTLLSVYCILSSSCIILLLPSVCLYQKTSGCILSCRLQFQWYMFLGFWGDTKYFLFFNMQWDDS